MRCRENETRILKLESFRFIQSRCRREYGMHTLFNLHSHVEFVMCRNPGHHNQVSATGLQPRSQEWPDRLQQDGKLKFLLNHDPGFVCSECELSGVAKTCQQDCGERAACWAWRNVGNGLFGVPLEQTSVGGSPDALVWIMCPFVKLSRMKFSVDVVTLAEMWA